MTVKELSQLYWLDREIEADKRRIEELEQAAGSPSAAQLTGMPHAPNRASSKVEKFATEIADLRVILAARQIQRVHEFARLKRYIDEIEDSKTRQIFSLRFVDGLSWMEVADRLSDLYGKDLTDDAVKKCCYRYLKKVSESPTSPEYV